MMSPVLTAGKGPKSHLSLLKAGPSTAQIAFRSTGLQEEDFDGSIAN